MIQVGIWDKNPKLLGSVTGGGFTFGVPPAEFCDILAIGPNCPGTLRCRCRIAVIPGDTPPALLTGIDAERVITYGLGGRNTVTISGAAESCVVALLREIVTLGDVRLDRQEFVLPLSDAAPLEVQLCAYAVRLAADGNISHIR